MGDELSPLDEGKQHPYKGRTVAISTMHGKHEIIGPILDKRIGTKSVLASGINTDSLGTFSGDVARTGTPLQTAIEKARLGMAVTGKKLGIANEGSFGPHPQLPFFTSDMEIIVLVDGENDLVIEEYVVSPSTNVGEIKVADIHDAEEFLNKSLFGTHGMVVRPNSSLETANIKKGILDGKSLAEAIRLSAKRSSDGLAHIETDMRAHMNPTRQKVIAEASEKFAARVNTICPHCGLPGWGVVDCIMGLPCEGCGGPTAMVHKEIEGCVKCRFRKVLPRSDGKEKAPVNLCPECNP